MDLRKLEALATAVELGSFTKAAAKLGYTQSGLTHMMNALEREIGFPILLRDHHGVRLTDEGCRLFPKIQKILEINRQLCDEMDDIHAARAESCTREVAQKSPDHLPG